MRKLNVEPLSLTCIGHSCHDHIRVRQVIPDSWQWNRYSYSHLYSVGRCAYTYMHSYMHTHCIIFTYRHTNLFHSTFLGTLSFVPVPRLLFHHGNDPGNVVYTRPHPSIWFFYFTHPHSQTYSQWHLSACLCWNYSLIGWLYQRDWKHLGGNNLVFHVFCKPPCISEAAWPIV